MSALDVTFAILDIGAGIATFVVCGVIAWRILKGPEA